MSKVTTQSDVYIIQNADTMEPISDNKKIIFNKLWVYPGKGIAKEGDGSGLAIGRIIPNTEDIYLGEKAAGEKFTPDKISLDDPPILIELPQGETKLLSEILVQSPTAGNGVVIKFW
jgi:hypothetical protein